MGRKYQRHPLDFSQEFFPISQETFLFNIYRFQVFRYEPCSLTPNNVQYYFLSDHDFGAGEFALVGLCNYKEDGKMKQDCQMIIKNGDLQVFHFIKLLLLQKLEQEKGNELVSVEKKRMVEIKNKV